MSETAELKVGGQTLELNVIEGTEGEKGIDITKLRAETGYITLDPGYANSGSCQSASPSSTVKRASSATAASRSKSSPQSRSFIEVSYLLIYGELPDSTELENFARRSVGTRCSTKTSRRCTRHCRRTRTRWPHVRRRSERSRRSTRTRSILATAPGRDLGRIADRQAADAGGLRLQALDRSALPLSPATASTTSATSCA